MRDQKVSAGEAQAVPVVIHLRSQVGQPYGSVRRCCNYCGVMLVGPEPKWVEWEEELRNLPNGYINCQTLNRDLP